MRKSKSNDIIDAKETIKEEYMLVTGCSNEFAKTQYDSNDKIAEKSDRYLKSYSSTNSVGDSVTFTAGDFDGRETLWSRKYSEDQEVNVKITFTIASGKAKLVHIDDDANVSTIVECTSDSTVDEATTYIVTMKEGKNRFKLVGYDCEDVDLYMEIKD